MPTNFQPSLVLNQSLELSGVFPSRGSFIGITMGMVRTYGFNFAVGSFTDGHTMAISSNTALFSILGTTYGGDGRTTFGVPDLRGRVSIDDGQGPGLSQYFLGEMVGDSNFTVNNNNLPPSRGGLSIPIGDIQPENTLHFMIQTEGTFNAGSMWDLGRVVEFAGSFTPDSGYMDCDGRLLQISENDALFNLIGTTYGGDGITTFALPDLRGRTIIGTGNGFDGNYVLGQTVGQESVTLTVNNLPSALGGSSQPIDNHQPSLALNYMIALEGIFPPRDVSGGSNDTAFLGEIVTSATNNVPRGFALCNGQLLPIAQNQALFALLGTQFGGDGRTTFALPDLRGRAIVSQGNGFTMGDRLGTSTITLTNSDVVNPPPTASDGAASTHQNAVVSGQLVGADPYNQPISYHVVGDGAHGHVVVNADGSYIYTPASNYFGTDSFTFATNDGTSNSNTATVNVTIVPNNYPPTANGGTGTVNEDTPLTGTVTASDPEGLPLTYAKASNPAHGTVTVNSGGGYTYTPDANYYGTDSFTFTANDGTSTSAPATVNITVNPINDAPTGTASAVLPNGTEDQGYIVSKATLLQGFSDVDGDSLSVTGLGANHGTVSDNGDGTFTISPAGNYNGGMALSYTVSDGHGGNVAATQTYTVDAVNDAPTGAPTANLPHATEDQSYQIHLTGLLNGFSDVEGDSIAAANFVIDHGTVSGFSIPYFTITLEPNYHGLVTIHYNVIDFHGGSTPAVQTFIVDPVNDAPTATSSTPSTNEDTVLNGNVTGGDVDGDTLSFAQGSGPAHGTLDFHSDGSYTYTPNANYHGPDSFTFTANDGHVDSAPATVNITVNSVNDAPTATASTPSTNEDTALNGNVTGGDIDGDTLTFAQGSGPAHGTLDFHSDGSYTYTPDADYHGPDSFTFAANDGHVDSAPATVNITVNSVNDAPDLTSAQANLTDGTENTPYVVSAADLLQGFSDVDDAVLAITGLSADQGTVVNNGDGTFTITPTSGYNGPVSLSYTVTDGHGGNVGGTQLFTLQPVNDIPVGTPGNLLLNEDTPLNASLSASDGDGDSLTFSLASGPAHGTVSLLSDGNFIYTPAPNYNGTDSFTFTVWDGQAYSTPATVDLTIGAVNDGPSANDDTATVLAAGPRTINLTATALLSNDSDVDGDTLSITGVGAAAHGTVSFSNNGTSDASDDTVTYTPTVGYSGPDSFTYNVSDGHGGSTSATVNVTVQAATATTIYTQGTSGDDTIDKSATTISQLIAGVNGNDTLTGGTANDTLNGGAGNDILHGGKGVDSLTGGSGADQFFIAKGDMASGVDKITDFEGAGNGDVAGDDKILLEGFNAGATVTQISVVGNAHTYRVTDGAFTGTFVAVYAGSAVLQAGDYIFTPPPAVTYHSPVAGGDLATVLATGPRTINLTATSLMANDSDADGDAIFITGVTAAGHGVATFSDNGTATTADDYITYTPTTGYAGADSFSYILSDGTTTSNGTVSITVQAETVSGPTYTSGTSGNDTYNFSAATATQTVAGNGGHDTITTGSAADTINGGAGDDVINGGGAKDTLTGGTGADTFVFTSADSDKIVDFSVADDTIALSKATFGAITEQNAVDHILTAAEFVIGAAATNTSQHVIYNASTGALWYDADGSGVGAAVQIALLSKNLTLTHDDFVVWG